MPRIAYVNGRYLPHASASVSIDDRGYQFADGVYEVLGVQNELLYNEDAHFERLTRSLNELRISWPVKPAVLKIILRRVIRKNLVKNGQVYLQVTRGVAPRNHLFPAHNFSSIVVTATPGTPFDKGKILAGVKVVTLPENRWKRRDIKSISLLPNVLSKQEAWEKGGAEAWLVDDDGKITEGTSSNAWIVTKDGKLLTRHLGCEILGGVTRRTILSIASQQGLDFVERAFSVAEALEAKEAFLTSTTTFLKPVITIDETKVGVGEAGELTRTLLDWYEDYIYGKVCSSQERTQ